MNPDEGRLRELLGFLEQMAGGDLAVRLPTSAARDHLDALAFGINILADEISYKQRQEQQVLNELKSAQAQLLQSAKLAALGALCAGMAHEINNPLTIIRGYVEHLELSLKKTGAINHEQAKTYFDKINRGIDRVVDIVKNVKNFARSKRDNFSSLDVQSLINSSLELLAQQLYLKQIEVKKNFPEQATYVYGDPSQLEQVFINILTNAKDAVEAASQEKRGTIDLIVNSTDENVSISVEDNGIGVEDHLIARVFDPFFTTKDVGSGTGLGLSISHRIIKDHGGSIDFSSKINVGTRVTLRFPKHRVEEGHGANK